MGSDPENGSFFFFFLLPLPIDHPLAGVGRFYGGVHIAYVVASSAYGPVEGVAVVDVEPVVAGAALGHVAVVGVTVGPQEVVVALGDHPVGHPVADPLEEHLAVAGGDAGDIIALDRPPDHLGEGGTTTGAHQRYERYGHHRHHHHRS